MPKHYVYIALVLFGSYAFAGPRWSAGLGYEGRMQREVNPDYIETKGVPHFFARAAWTDWQAQAEISSESQASDAGALKIMSKTLAVSGWARYAFLPAKRLRPFVSGGAGVYLDKVTSEFGATSNESEGTRPFFGTGGGIFAVYWDHLLVEAEGRINFVRERKEPLVAALFKIGYVF